jgi:Prenyltransferase and squalene oxidase repeat
MPDSHQRVLEYLFNNLNNGYWGYHPKQEPSIEATAWSLIAFCQQPNDEVTKTVSGFLLRSQNDDGGWSTSPKIGKSDWSAAPASLALRLLLASQNKQLDLAGIQKSLRLAFRYLFDSRVDFFGPVARLLLLLYQGPSALNYGRGWPWTPKSYNWVEPTSYSLLALKIPNLPSPEEYNYVVEHAHQFLTTHACRGGGWNHGAYYCLKKYAPAYVLTTAEALLALQDLKENKVVEEGLQFLKGTFLENPTCLSLAWTVMVFSAYGIDYQIAMDLLQSKQNKDGSFGSNILVTALAATALSVCRDGKHPLLIKPKG